MKHVKTILALLLCLCMLPLNALAYTVEPGGTHPATQYTPAQSGLYAVTVTKDGKTLSPLPAKEGSKTIYDPAVTVSATSADGAAQQVDYNVFYLVKGTSYSVQLKSTEGYDDSGEWTVSVAPVACTELTAGEAVEGEWFTFTPAESGSYDVTGTPVPVFVEAMTAGSVSGDWDSYALDKEICRLAMELDYLRSLKTAMAGRAEALDQAEDTYNKALAKLDNYNKLFDLTEQAGISEAASGTIAKKQIVYDALKAALKRGDSSIEVTVPFMGTLLDKLNLPTIDKSVLDELPANVTDLPNFLTERIQSNEGLVGEAKARYEEQKAQQDADQARYDAGIAANPQLAALVDDKTVETASVRQQVQTDADAIQSGAAALAASEGMELKAAQWLNTEDDVLTVPMTAGTTYVLHALSNLPAAVGVVKTGEEPPAPVVDKTALQKAISDAEAVDTAKYTDDTVAAMTAALDAAKAVNANADATQADVNAAAKNLNDAVKALKEKDVTPPTVDKTALQKAISDAEAVDTSKYTDASVAAMNAALDAAKAANEDPDATQAVVDAAAASLNAAVKDLKAKPVDKTALQAAIDQADALDRSKYTDESYAAVGTALITAKAVNLNPFATQERVDEVTKALNDAMDALVEKDDTPTVDKTALQKAIADAEAVDTAKYTDDTVAAMNAALETAKGVNGSTDATQADVDAAAKLLNDAIGALKEKDVTPAVDKTALQEAIARAEAIDTTKYTDESVAALQRALTAAKAVLGADAVQQAGVDNTTKALNDAIDALQEKEEPPVTQVDKTALQEAIAKAEAVDRDKYTDDSLAAMDQQLASAKETLADAAATQAQVNLAARRLNNAVSSLQEKTEPQPTKFVDVPDGAYYAPAVDWAVANGITNGTDATHFSPKNDCTRAQIVTFLWRANHEPAPKTTVNPFYDVSVNDYYYTAVLWAVGEGITNGTDEHHFSPKDTCTRAQAVTFLWRMEHEPAPKSAVNPFADVLSTNYFYNAVLWAVGEEITNGTDATHFSPKDNCSRAQIVTFLYRDRADA